MITRAILFGLIASVSLTSGCACCDNPCWGFRLHPYSHCAPCGSCAPCGGCPAYSSPVVSGPIIPGPGPIAYRLPSGPDCPSCGNGSAVISGMPHAGYPPIIGNPMPLPGVTPSDMIPNPMPVKN